MRNLSAPQQEALLLVVFFELFLEDAEHFFHLLILKVSPLGNVSLGVGKDALCGVASD